MATFDKCIYDIPPYQEGNEADFEFDLDANFPMERVSDITLQVRNSKGELIMSKTKAYGDIKVLDKTVTIPFLPADTKGKSGTHIYEIDFVNNDGNPFATIGGAFVINKEINTL